MITYAGRPKITLMDITEIISDLERKKTNTEKYLELEKEFLCSLTKSMLLSDIDLFKRYIEMASDISGEDTGNQDLMRQFIDCKERAVSGTLYEERIARIENEL